MKLMTMKKNNVQNKVFAIDDDILASFQNNVIAINFLWMIIY